MNGIGTKKLSKIRLASNRWVKDLLASPVGAERMRMREGDVKGRKSGGALGTSHRLVSMWDTDTLLVLGLRSAECVNGTREAEGIDSALL
jgi:hypothetical protein